MSRPVRHAATARRHNVPVGAALVLATLMFVGGDLLGLLTDERHGR